MPYEIDNLKGDKWIKDTLEAAREDVRQLPEYAIYAGYWKVSEPSGWSMGGATWTRQSLIEAVRR